MYLRYNEEDFIEQPNNKYKQNIESPKGKKREKSKTELIICLSFILFILEYTKQHGYVTSTTGQFVLAFTLAIIVKFVVESFVKWISD